MLRREEHAPSPGPSPNFGRGAGGEATGPGEASRDWRGGEIRADARSVGESEGQIDLDDAVDAPLLRAVLHLGDDLAQRLEGRLVV